ncbi:MAG: MBOAT family protein, partial [Planctomycetaceae bacterium]
MLFCSLEFLPFFAVVFGLYWLLPWNRARVGLLLVASFWFYSCWNHWLALLIVASTTLDFAIGLGLERFSRTATRRALLLTSLGFNLGLLAYFKYVNFFLDSLQQTLRLAGWQTAWPTLQVLLPVGISFYTFEAISYSVDVYRGRVKAERNLAHFLLFILFFPHLVAGPIVRARDFLPQVARPKRLSWLRAQLGVDLFLLFPPPP